MKKVILFFVLISLNTPVKASFPIFNDKIILQEPCANLFLRNGTEISCRILEITPDIIKYKRCNLQNSPEISIFKAEVLMIRYSNGDKEIFEKTAVKPSSQNILAQDIFSILSLLFAIFGLGYSPVILGIAAILFGLIGSNSRLNVLAIIGIILGFIEIAYFFKPI